PISQSNPNFRSSTNAYQMIVAFSSSWNRTKRRNAKERPYASYLRNTINLIHIGCERSDLFPSVLRAAEERTNSRLLVCSQNYPRPCELPTKQATKQSQGRFFSILLTRLQILHLR